MLFIHLYIVLRLPPLHLNVGLGLLVALRDACPQLVPLLLLLLHHLCLMIKCFVFIFFRHSYCVVTSLVRETCLKK